MNTIIGWIQNLWDTFWGVDYDLDLPPSWPTSKCWDCGAECPPDCWRKFVEISGKAYSVPNCDSCMDKQEEEIRKANRERIGKDYPESENDDPPKMESGEQIQ